MRLLLRQLIAQQQIIDSALFIQRVKIHSLKGLLVTMVKPPHPTELGVRPLQVIKPCGATRIRLVSADKVLYVVRGAQMARSTRSQEGS